MALIYVAAMMVLLLGFASLAVDWGQVQLAKTQLMEATDAAARAAAASIASGVSSAQTAAVTFGGYNSVNGTSFVVNPNTDIDFGTWTTGSRTFTVLSGAARSNANAIRVWGRRTAANGNAIRLTFGAVVGASSCDITVSSVAAVASGQPAGFVGLSSFPIDKKLFAASYNSSVTTSPSHANYNSNALLQSNGVVGQGSHAGCWLYGNTEVGPSGSVAGGINVTGTSTTLSSNITAPAVTMQVVSNPGGISANETLSSNATWQGGTYYFTSLTVATGVSLTFSGPATVYVNGNITIASGNSLTAYNSIPSNLKVFQASGNTFSGTTTDTFIGVYDGPGCSVSFGNAALLEGSMTANSITLADNDDVYYDEALASSFAGSISVVR
jgi:hypothetical protein